MRRISILVVVALMTLTACGKVAEQVAEKAAEQATEQVLSSSDDDGGGASADIGDDTEGIKISGTDADTGEDFETQIGGTEVPPEFPMPIHPSAEVIDVSSMTVGEESAYQVNLRIDPKDRDEILDFYEQWIRDQGMEVIRAEDGVLGTADDGAVAAVAFDDYGDYGEIGLGWSP